MSSKWCPLSSSSPTCPCHPDHLWKWLNEIRTKDKDDLLVLSQWNACLSRRCQWRDPSARHAPCDLRSIRHFLSNQEKKRWHTILSLSQISLVVKKAPTVLHMLLSSSGLSVEFLSGCQGAWKNSGSITWKGTLWTFRWNSYNWR